MKRGQLEIFGILILIAVILLTLIFGLPLVLRYILHVSILTFSGILILIIVGGSYLIGKPIPPVIALYLIFASIPLILLPYIFPNMSRLTILAIAAQPGPP